MVRIQIQLTEHQVTTLKELAAAEGRSMAELIRRSVDVFLRSKAHRSREDKKCRALDAVGRFRSEVADLSIHHDRYLSEAFGE